ncbi:T9SS type A sorting domain-containing protein, partial [candidate division WOR-3 bacterium]|nr:T9SS type A sorting domain-containing protein [candidate division WOR-3 bacterium]MBD3364504.1 T9SS type A sorting domain-containing protein [candidate division WOR-3 bacterium]
NLGNIPVDGTGGFTADFNFDGSLDIFLNAHNSGTPFEGRSPILWGPDYTSADFLDHDGYDHHGVFREAGNVYDRTFTAWYYSNVFDSDPYNFTKNGKLTYIGYEPENSYITFSTRSGPDSVVNSSWTDWYEVQNEYANPKSLKWRYVQYRAEFHYSRPCWLPWLERIQLKFWPLDFDLRLYPDSLKTVSKDSYIEYPLTLYYKGDEDDSFWLDLRTPPFGEGWRAELWDTAYIDTIPWNIKLMEVIPQGIDTPFFARIYPAEDAQPGDTNVTIIWTRTLRCSKLRQDSVILYTVVANDGSLEGWIDGPVRLEALAVSDEGVVNYSVPHGQTGNLTVYDPSGRRVYTEPLQGAGQTKWSDADMPLGLYFVRLETPAETLVRKVILTR